ncbi:Protocadherin-10 [Mactra antiquata]
MTRCYNADNGNMSVFVLMLEDSRVTYCNGFFEHIRYTYNVYSQTIDKSTIRYTIYRYKKAVHEETLSSKIYPFKLPFIPSTRDHQSSHEDVNENIMTDNMEKSDIEVLTPVYMRHREARQVQLYEIEIFFVMDFSLYLQISKAAFKKTDSGQMFISDEIFINEIIVILHGINARFQNIRGSNYIIDVVLAGIYLSKNISSSSWSKCSKRRSSLRPVITEESLTSFIEWTNKRKHNLPQYDHAMAITACNLQNKDNQKTIGLGYQQSMCTNRRYSIVEHHGNTAYVTYIATHELAHSLGAKHDGYPVTVSYNDITKSCYSNDGYIMSATASSIPDALEQNWKFSECSLLYFDFFIDHLNANHSNCMTSTNGQVVSSQQRISMVTMYTADLQCKRTLGDGFVLDRRAANPDPFKICQALPCKNILTNSRENILSLSGTRCGNDKICNFGECVGVTSTVENQRSEDECIFGDQPGSLRIDGLTCNDLKAIENAYLCYKFQQECCNTCRFHERRYLDENDCTYGDRKLKCSARDCEGNLCCETCMLLQGLLPEFSSESMVEVNENIPSDKVIHTIATGNVTSSFKLVYYSHPGFKVTKDGHLSIDNGYVIDYERVRSYTMIIEATSVSDYRIQAIQRLTITVLDENEHLPAFTEDNICIEISSLAQQDIVVHAIHATDLDLSTTNITYGLVRPLDYANLSHVTGELTIFRSYFIEKPSLKQVELEIYAKDSGIPELTSTCTVEIRVDNPCVLTNTSTVSCQCSYLMHGLGILIVYIYCSYLQNWLL